jgi:hypothetical protein
MSGSFRPEIICPVVRVRPFFVMAPRIILLGAVSAALTLAASALRAQDALPHERPRITGLSHVALWVSDLEKSRAFYKGYLGFEEPYSLGNPDGGVLITWI